LVHEQLCVLQYVHIGEPREYLVGDQIHEREVDQFESIGSHLMPCVLQMALKLEYPRQVPRIVCNDEAGIC